MKRSLLHFAWLTKKSGYWYEDIGADLPRSSRRKEAALSRPLHCVAAHLRTTFFKYVMGHAPSRDAARSEDSADDILARCGFLLSLLCGAKKDLVARTAAGQTIMDLNDDLLTCDTFLEAMSLRFPVEHLDANNKVRLYQHTKAMVRHWLACSVRVLLISASGLEDSNEYLPIKMTREERVAVRRDVLVKQRHSRVWETDYPRTTNHYMDFKISSDPAGCHEALPSTLQGLKALHELQHACCRVAERLSTSVPAYSLVLKHLMAMSLALVADKAPAMDSEIVGADHRLASASTDWMASYGGNQFVKAYLVDFVFRHLRPNLAPQKAGVHCYELIESGWLLYDFSVRRGDQAVSADAHDAVRSTGPT